MPAESKPEYECACEVVPEDVSITLHRSRFGGSVLTAGSLDDGATAAAFLRKLADEIEKNVAARKSAEKEKADAV